MLLFYCTLLTDWFILQLGEQRLLRCINYVNTTQFNFCFERLNVIYGKLTAHSTNCQTKYIGHGYCP
jgi:hypothetical protein